MGPHEDRWCQRCRVRNETIDGVCRCGWNVDEDRETTESERAAVLSKLDQACADLQAALDEPLPADAVRLIAQQDQLVARLKKMTDCQREHAAVNMAEDGMLTYDEALAWINERLEECGDA